MILISGQVKEYKSNESLYTGLSQFNDLSFIIQNLINKIATAIPVKVMAVDVDNGFVDVLPLVTFISSDMEVIPPTTLYRLPYSRVHGGIAALIIDPVVGDIGLAVFAQKDCSNVKKGITEPVKPGSYRKYSFSDGFYIGGFLNKVPTCYLELKQDKTAILNATGGVTINGDVTINGKLDVTGNISSTNAGVTMLTHTHTGVHGETTTGHG